MQIKAALDKLDLGVSIREMCESQERDNGLKLVTISLDHIARLDTLEPVHRDPFDRMLIAQAINEGMTLVSADTIFSRYPVTTLW
jgi:PIN domain nuclease of toxin-antitoxin system